MLLMITAYTFALSIGTLLGLLAAVARNTWRDAVILVATLICYATLGFFRASLTPQQHEARARRLENTLVTTFGRDFAVAHTEYVILATGKRGRQSQTWRRTPDGSRVVAAHVSMLA